MNIAGRQIGPDHPVYVIAEIGVNHDGSTARALELVDAAADAGADAVKFQCFQTDRLMSRASKLAAYQKAAGETDPVEMLRRLELSVDDLEQCARRAHKRGVHAIVTVFSLELVALAEGVPWDAYKTASPDIIHKPMLEALAATGRPMIISTGASERDEVSRAAAWVRTWGAADRTAFLHCVSSYPTEPRCATLGAIRDVARLCQGMPVGYSDHTALVETGRDAAAMGACILEKHLTDDGRGAGPDHAASLDPDQFRSYAALAKDPIGAHEPDPVLIGSDRKQVLECERDVRTVSRQSVVWAREVEAGAVVSPTDLTFKRPGTGVEPFRIHELVGRVTARRIEPDTPVAWGDLR